MQINEVTTKSVIIKDTTSRGTTPPPVSVLDAYPINQTVYYPKSYEMKEQQAVSTVRYRTPSPTTHPTTTTSEVVVEQQPPTTTKTSTQILETKTLPTLRDDSFIEQTKSTTTVIKPIEGPTAAPGITSSITTAPKATKTTVAPTIETTTIDKRPVYRTQQYRRRRRRIRTRSTSTFSGSTTSSTSSDITSSTITPRSGLVQQRTILPPRPPIQTTIINDPPKTIVPQQRFIHRAHRVRTYSGYYSSDLDYGKRKIYKSDYKYRHYYCCNWFKGRCDLANRSCSCCEWFYGCPLWGFLLLGLLFLVLTVAFFALLGLQPTINSARRSATAGTQLLNRTVIIFGFLQNCGTQNDTLTTLALCTNTGTTSTSRVELSPSFMTLKGTKFSFNKKFLILLCFLMFILTFSYV